VIVRGDFISFAAKKGGRKYVTYEDETYVDLRERNQLLLGILRISG